jgi:hypothetical protein
VIVFPPTETVPLRGDDDALAVTVSVNVPLPEPDRADGWIQLSDGKFTHPQPDVIVIVTVPPPAPMLTVCGDTV